MLVSIGCNGSEWLFLGGPVVTIVKFIRAATDKIIRVTNAWEAILLSQVRDNSSNFIQLSHLEIFLLSALFFAFVRISLVSLWRFDLFLPEYHLLVESWDGRASRLFRFKVIGLFDLSTRWEIDIGTAVDRNGRVRQLLVQSFTNLLSAAWLTASLSLLNILMILLCRPLSLSNSLFSTIFLRVYDRWITIAAGSLLFHFLL